MVVTRAAIAAVCAIACAACGDAAPETAPQVASRVVVDSAAFPVAPVPEPDGGFLYAERLTGRVRRVSADGRLDPAPLGEVDTGGGETDQRGLVGLARLGDGRLFASWTRRDDGRLVVGEILPGSTPRVIWTGPVSADVANGGSLLALADGRLLIGVGDLTADPSLAVDVSVPNRKVLAVDPDSSSVEVLSSGWNNPFAVALDAAAPWVADNTGTEGGERLGRADRAADDATVIGDQTGQVAPAGLVALAGGRFGVCGYASGRLDEIAVGDAGATPTGRVLAAPCRTGAALLSDGRAILLTPDAVYLTADPLP